MALVFFYFYLRFICLAYFTLSVIFLIFYRNFIVLIAVLFFYCICLKMLLNSSPIFAL
ncbi:hypothetical protein DCF50_p675 [Dehalobacter sp. CF]|nr:hypothetical protein DCF50_p675 [Dehalobacter sp. CF]